MNYFFALLFIALNPLFTWASGPNDSQKSTIRCPAPEDLSAVHLYGLWHAEVDGQPTPQSVQFVRHPENTGSVRGQVTRVGVTVQVAGDVDNGEFSLE